EVISLSDSVDDDDDDSDIEIIEPAVVDLDAVEGGVAIEAPWRGTAMYAEDENGVILLDEDMEDDRAAAAAVVPGIPSHSSPEGPHEELEGHLSAGAVSLELPPEARSRYARGKSIEFSPLSVSTSASTADEHAKELWNR
ncbi:AP-3 complex subunit mu-2, partial [Perkinsus olseni]